MIDICEYSKYHLFFRYTEVGIVLGRWWVGTVVDDTVLGVSKCHLELGKVADHIETVVREASSIRKEFTHYKLSNVGIELGVINWEVRGYLSEIHLKNWGLVAAASIDHVDLL